MIKHMIAAVLVGTTATIGAVILSGFGAVIVLIGGAVSIYLLHIAGNPTPPTTTRATL